MPMCPTLRGHVDAAAAAAPETAAEALRALRAVFVHASGALTTPRALGRALSEWAPALASPRLAVVASLPFPVVVLTGYQIDLTLFPFSAIPSREC